MGLPAPLCPTLLDPDAMFGRVEMMLEEIKELMEAYRTRRVLSRPDAIAEITDALIDLVYFALGAAVMMGIPWDQCWDIVQEANMQKELVGNPSESKRHNVLDVKKPVGWVDPRFEIAVVLTKILNDFAGLSRAESQGEAP
jgi:hypothetical protein